MGACVSAAGGVSEEEKAKHREAERQLREQKAKLDSQVKVSLSLSCFDDCLIVIHRLWLSVVSLLGSFIRLGRLWEVNYPQSQYSNRVFDAVLPSFLWWFLNERIMHARAR